MMDHSRLPAGLEAAALRRKAEASGGNVTVLRKGDPDRGSILLFLGSRGRHSACLERALGPDGAYRWTVVGPDDSASSIELTSFLDKRARFDADLWALELDVAHPERFIAEISAEG